MLFKTQTIDLAKYGAEGQIVVKALTGKVMRELTNATKGIDPESQEFNTLASYITCKECVISMTGLEAGKKLTDDDVDELPATLIAEIVQVAGDIQNDIPLSNSQGSQA